MISNILSAETKQHLEQERSRLLQDRDQMIQAAIAQATIEIDRVLQSINQVLGNDLSASQESSPALPQTSSQQQQRSFDANALKPEFKGQKPMAAILSVLVPEKTVSIDGLIDQLYEPFDAADLSRARKSVAATLLHAQRRGSIEKIQDDPALFRLKA